MTSPTTATTTRTGPCTRISEKSKHDLNKSAQDGEPITEDEEIAALGPAPDGGLKAWLNAAGGFCIFFSCLGFTSCFGVLQEYYSTHQLRDHTMNQIAWIGSLASFIQFAGGALGGPMFDRYGVWILRPATFVYVLGLMMVSLCTEYYQFMLAQGILMSTAVAFLQFPAFAVVSQYFDKKRAAALGLIVSGSSIGGIIFPIVLSKLLNSSTVSFGWSIRIVAFIILPFMVFACVAIRPRVPPRTTTVFIGEAWRMPKYVLLVVSFFFMMMGMWTPVFYIPVYAVSRGMKPVLASYLLAIINGSSTFGRIIPGILADKLGRLNIFAFSGIATGVMVFCINEPRTNTGIIVYAIFFGFISGTIISSASAAISLCTKDPRNIGTYMGMGMGISAFAVLLGPPINGALIDSYGGFTQVSIFSGVVSLVGGTVALASKFATPEGILGKV
ncbi:MFS general substrate transporter [Clathrospora elynae]|uniref:MFS general substrate transporter n=1 Tax=Clathrospora elynae TaxID=706981 RepID=A0A6A5SES5_9PLEO|nr:MFS general substrate transporter [Clathrospora elynae]